MFSQSVPKGGKFSGKVTSRCFWAPLQCGHQRGLKNFKVGEVHEDKCYSIITSGMCFFNLHTRSLTTTLAITMIPYFDIQSHIHVTTNFPLNIKKLTLVQGNDGGRCLCLLLNLCAPF